MYSNARPFECEVIQIGVCGLLIYNFFFDNENYLLLLGIIKQRTLVCTNSPQNIYKINVIEPDCNETLGYHSLLFYALYDEASSLQTQWQLI